MNVSDIYDPLLWLRANAQLGVPQSPALRRIRHPFMERLRAEGKDRPAPHLDFAGALRMVLMVAVGFLLTTAVLDAISGGLRR